MEVSQIKLGTPNHHKSRHKASILRELSTKETIKYDEPFSDKGVPPWPWKPPTRW